jgi:hypothetical protein
MTMTPTPQQRRELYQQLSTTMSVEFMAAMRDQMIADGLPDPDSSVPAELEAERARLADLVGEEAVADAVPPHEEEGE